MRSRFSENPKLKKASLRATTENLETTKSIAIGSSENPETAARTCPELLE